MIQLKGNLWQFHSQGNWIVVPTNGCVKMTGECVMGRGVAAQAKARFPNLPKLLGQALDGTGNQVYFFQAERILSFPVKHNWWEMADLDLIRRSANQLLSVVTMHKLPAVYLPQVGCGNGGLTWAQVEPELGILDSRFHLVLYDPTPAKGARIGK